MSDYDDLRAKALAATPGPWHAEHDIGASRVVSERYYGGVTGGGLLNEDATYIAAVSPDVVLELLDHVDRLQRYAMSNGTASLDWQDRAEAAEAAVERVRALADQKEAEADRINNTWDPITKRYSGVRPFALIDAVREALDGPGAAASVEVDSGSTGDANGPQEAVTRLGEQVDRLKRVAATEHRAPEHEHVWQKTEPSGWFCHLCNTLLLYKIKGASGAREGGTA